MGRARVVVLGGGVGGLAVASLLKENAPEHAAVVLVDRKKEFQFPPSYPWLALGARKRAQVQRDLALLRKKGIEVHRDEVESIDLRGRRVRTRRAELSYDHLVIALGAEYDLDLIPGFRESAFHVYDLESALRFQEAVEGFRGGTVAVGVARTPFKCPAAPYEMALLLEDHFAKRGMRERVRFEFFTAEPAPVPSVGPEIGSQVLDLLKSRGIPYHPKRKLVHIGPSELRFETGDSLPFDLLFCVPPHRAPKPVVDAGLTDGTGWIPVDAQTLRTAHKDVYAIGDITSLSTPNGYVPFLPKAGVFAHGQAEIVAHNLAVRVRGRGKEKQWDGHGSCFLEVGGGKGAYLKGDFLAAPRPTIEFHPPSRVWHLQKVLFEKYWMRRWFLRPR